MSGEIVKGWYNVVMSYLRDDNHLVEKEAKRKLNICNKVCGKKIKNLACPICSCPLIALLRSDKKCPKKEF
jgi:hypothetical protein